MFQKISDYFIHPAIRQDKIMYNRAKTFLILLLFFLVVLIGYACLFIFNGVFFNLKAFINYLGVFAALISLIMLRRSNNLIHPLRFLSYGSIGLISCGVYLSGGFASNDILWYLAASMSAFLFIGRTHGILMTGLSLIAISIFYLIDVFDWMDLPVDPLTSSIHYRFSNSVAITLILFFLVWILVKSNNELQKIVHDIQDSRVRESISQDFHDELGNKLASVIHLSKRLKNTKSDVEKSEMLRIIENESQKVYDNFRDFIWTNEPDKRTVESLFMYLSDFNQQFFGQTDIQVEGQLFPEKKTHDEQLPALVVRHVIPLFKELMTNIYKHANAKRVDWSISCIENRFALQVKDNGKGFDVKNHKPGTGLKSLKKRAEHLHASLEITSDPLEGTSFYLSLDTNVNTLQDD